MEVLLSVLLQIVVPLFLGVKVGKYVIKPLIVIALFIILLNIFSHQIDSTTDFLSEFSSLSVESVQWLRNQTSDLTVGSLILGLLLGLLFSIISKNGPTIFGAWLNPPK